MSDDEIGYYLKTKRNRINSIKNANEKIHKNNIYSTDFLVPKNFKKDQMQEKLKDIVNNLI